MFRRLALYSDQIPPVTDKIDQAVMRWLPSSGGTIGYIPSEPDPEGYWFNQRRDYYARYGLSAHFFGLEEGFDAGALGDLFSCEAIHLTGGNTFRFLYWLRERGIMDGLSRYVADGGVLIGVSAGAILMTPEVGTSLLCGDVPYRDIQGGEGLGLVDFAVVPHFDGSIQASEALVRFSIQYPGVVYGIPDGAGILVDGDRQELIGAIQTVYRGESVT